MSFCVKMFSGFAISNPMLDYGRLVTFGRPLLAHCRANALRGGNNKMRSFSVEDYLRSNRECPKESLLQAVKCRKRVSRVSRKCLGSVTEEYGGYQSRSARVAADRSNHHVDKWLARRDQKKPSSSRLPLPFVFE